MVTLHSEIQEIVDVLVELIRKGEARINVVDRGMMLARRFEHRTASKVTVSDIPSPVSRICTYDNDAAQLACFNGDDIEAGWRLANLAVDQIRFEDKVNGTTTPVTPKEWLDTIVERFMACDAKLPRLQNAEDGPGQELWLKEAAVLDLFQQIQELSGYLRYELHVIGESLDIPVDVRERAEIWVNSDPGFADGYSKKAMIAVLLAVYEKLLDTKR